MFTYNSITNHEVGPVYLHCWNGYQSGFVSKHFIETVLWFFYRNSTSLLGGLYLIIGLEDMIELEILIRDFIPLEKYSISDEIKNEICPCYNDERSNDKIMVQNNNDELKSLKITVLFPSNISDLPPSVSTFLDEYGTRI